MINLIAVMSLCTVIRPSTGHPHTRRLKKHDPVNRYHEIQRLWADFKAPGEDARHDLRWRIRVCAPQYYQLHPVEVCSVLVYIGAALTRCSVLRGEANSITTYMYSIQS